MLLSSLRRVLVASGLVAVTSFMASTAAFAAPKTANVTIIGNVASTLAFSATNSTPPLDLTKLSNDTTMVASLTYSTNANGLTVAVAGTVPLALVNGANPPIPYELGTGTNTGSNYKGAPGLLFETNAPVPVGTSINLFIRSTSAVALFPGNYSQSLTLTATDK